MKHITAFFADDSGRFEVATGTFVTFLGAFLAGIGVMQREWLHAALHFALAVTGYCVASTFIRNRAVKRTINEVRARVERARAREE